MEVGPNYRRRRITSTGVLIVADTVRIDGLVEALGHVIWLKNV
jgi:hypothetical protein